MGDAHLRLSVHRQSRIQRRPGTGFGLFRTPTCTVLSSSRRPTKGDVRDPLRTGRPSTTLSLRDHALVTGKPPQRVLGYETVTTGIAGPEIADDVVGNVGGSFGSYHGICANRAGRHIASARIGMTRFGRQDCSNS